MDLSRRSFLKTGVAGAVGLSALGFDLQPLQAQSSTLKISRTTQTRSTCPYCSVSCGVIIHTIGDSAKNVTPQVVHVEGDPDHPINRGTLCPKGASLQQDIVNDRRLLKPQVRRPGSDHWEDISWDQAIDEIATRIKKTRDETFIETDANGKAVNRCERHRLYRRLHRHQRVQLPRRQDHAQPGGLLPGKPGPCLTRPHGLQFGANIRTRGDDQRLDRHQEHRHDVDHGRQSGREPSLRLQVGDRSQAQPQREDDRRRSALHAHRRTGGSIPADSRRIRHRFSRRADQLRHSRTIASHDDYLVNYTNAAFIVKDGFKLPEDGLYSGFDQNAKTYDKTTWNYEEVGPFPAAGTALHSVASHEQSGSTAHSAEGQGYQAQGPAGAKGMGGGPVPPPMLPPNVAYDLTLQHPRCVFQLLKQQYSRYTPEMVERITGIPKDQVLKAADTLHLRSQRRRHEEGRHHHLRRRLDAAHLRHADHPHGGDAAVAARQCRTRRRRRQRAARPLQHSGRDRHGRRLRHPARLSQDADARRHGLARLISTRITPKASKPNEWDSFNYWSNTPKFTVSFLKAMYGDAATKENDLAFNYLPKIDRKYSWAEIWDDMYNGNVKGMLAFGMNGVTIGPEFEEEHRRAEESRLAGRLRNLSRRDQRVLESARHHARRDEEDQHDGLPAAGRGLRREGRHVRQLGALAAVEERRGAASRRLQARSGDSGAHLSEGPRALSEGRRQVPRSDPETLAGATRIRTIRRSPRSRRRSTARRSPTSPIRRPTARSRPASSFPASPGLRDDGSTHVRQLALLRLVDRSRRSDRSAAAPTILPASASIPNWAWSWPANRRVLYNRASCDLNGKPWDPDRKQVWWNEATAEVGRQRRAGFQGRLRRPRTTWVRSS